MTYVDGFITAVAEGDQEKYLDFTRRAWVLFKALGAISSVENWGDDVPIGKNTDFRRAVQAGANEAIVFSWITWPDKATRDAAMKVMMSDDTMERLGPMPFDGSRMIFGGFSTIFTSRDDT